MRTTTHFYRISFAFSVVLIVTTLGGCNCPNPKEIAAPRNQYSSIEDTLYLPFDTTKVIRLMNITTALDETKQFDETAVKGLEKEWDTLVLTYHAYACDCPSWLIEKENKAHPEMQTLMSKPFGYYIESGSKKLELDGRLYFSGNTIRFIGKHYKKPGLPNTQFTDPNPTPGNVFRYYAYEVLKPAAVWGPLYHTGKPEIPSDTVEMITTSKIVLPAE